MTVRTEPAPAATPTRVRAFAQFFKSYMSVATIAAASIPIPVATWKLIPLYAQQRGFLTVYTSLFCFLLLAFVFSIRHRLAPLMFSAGAKSALLAALPMGFIFSTLACILEYHYLVRISIQRLRLLGLNRSTAELLAKMDSTEIPYALPLAAAYLGIFLSAEAAFILMAIREYLQDVLRLDETALLTGSAANRTNASERVSS